jgi:hypothetical protein
MSSRLSFSRAVPLFVAALWGASSLVACNSQRESDRAEASRVFRALEMVRGAPNENKRRPAEELAHMPCTSPINCAVRDSCGDAYLHLASGTEAALKVKNELDRLERDPPDAADKVGELSGELDRADREINGAKESLRRCEEAASVMRRTFGI